MPPITASSGADRPAEEVRAETNTEPLTVEMAEPAEALTARTNTGSLELAVPAMAYSVRASSETGEAVVEVHARVCWRRAPANDGGVAAPEPGQPLTPGGCGLTMVSWPRPHHSDVTTCGSPMRAPTTAACGSAPIPTDGWWC